MIARPNLCSTFTRRRSLPASVPSSRYIQPCLTEIQTQHLNLELACLYFLQTSLTKLLETLNRAEPFFIRCIRSNAQKVKLLLSVFFQFSILCISHFRLFSPLFDFTYSNLKLKEYLNKIFFFDIGANFHCNLMKYANYPLHKTYCSDAKCVYEG